MPDVVPHVGVPVFSGDKWDEFVTGADLGHVRLDHYYLGGVLDPYLPLANTIQNRVLSELFADAADVGAIRLPDDYAPTDFVFEAELAKERLVKHVDVVLGSKPYLKSTFVVPYCFRENPLLSSLVTVETLRKVFEGAKFVISRDFFRPSLKF